MKHKCKVTKSCNNQGIKIEWNSDLDLVLIERIYENEKVMEY